MPTTLISDQVEIYKKAQEDVRLDNSSLLTIRNSTLLTYFPLKQVCLIRRLYRKLLNHSIPTTIETYTTDKTTTDENNNTLTIITTQNSYGVITQTTATLVTDDAITETVTDLVASKTTETVTQSDKSSVVTETHSDGFVISRTVKDTTGSITYTSTIITDTSTGAITEIVTDLVASKTTETVTHSDKSSVVTETYSDGLVVVVVLQIDNSAVITEKRVDGTILETVKDTSGTITQTTTSIFTDGVTTTIVDDNVTNVTTKMVTQLDGTTIITETQNDRTRGVDIINIYKRATGVQNTRFIIVAGGVTDIHGNSIPYTVHTTYMSVNEIISVPATDEYEVDLPSSFTHNTVPVMTIATQDCKSIQSSCYFHVYSGELIFETDTYETEILLPTSGPDVTNTWNRLIDFAIVDTQTVYLPDGTVQKSLTKQVDGRVLETIITGDTRYIIKDSSDQIITNNTHTLVSEGTLHVFISAEHSYAHDDTGIMKNYSRIISPESTGDIYYSFPDFKAEFDTRGVISIPGTGLNHTSYTGGTITIPMEITVLCWIKAESGPINASKGYLIPVTDYITFKRNGTQYNLVIPNGGSGTTWRFVAGMTIPVANNGKWICLGHCSNRNTGVSSVYMILDITNPVLKTYTFAHSSVINRGITYTRHGGNYANMFNHISQLPNALGEIRFDYKLMNATEFQSYYDYSKTKYMDRY
jgi:hypothetical protein